METENEFETRKLHISVPATVYDFLREKRLFKKIDGVITQLLIEKYNIE